LRAKLRCDFAEQSLLGRLVGVAERGGRAFAFRRRDGRRDMLVGGLVAKRHRHEAKQRKEARSE
jgi:hypothetical protein